MVSAITKISIMVVIPVVLCLIIIIILSFNLLTSFLPLWIDDSIAVQETNHKQFYDNLSYLWGLKVASQYHKILLGHTLSMDFYQLLKTNQALIANTQFNPSLLNKIALAQDRIRRSTYDALNAANGAKGFTTWYHSGFTESAQFDSFTDTKTNLLQYAIYMDTVLRPFFNTQIEFLNNEAVNITFENDGLLYSYPALKDTNFENGKNTDGCTHAASLFAYDDRCASYYTATKSASTTLKINSPFRQAAGKNLRQVICQKNNKDSTAFQAMICNQMNLRDLNSTYYESLNRIQDAYPGYFFIVSADDNLQTLLHPYIDVSQTTLASVWDKELNDTYTAPLLADFKKVFTVTDLTTNSLMVVTPLDAVGNTADGLHPEKVDEKENPAYKTISFTDTSGENAKDLMVKPIMIHILSEDKKLLEKMPIFYMGLVINKISAVDSFNGFKDFMNEVIYLLILLLMQIFLAIILYTLRFSGLVFRQMLQPIRDIVEEMEKLDTEDAEKFDLLGKVDKRDSVEIYNIRGVFQKLIQVMKAAKGAYNAGNDTLALLNFAQAKVFYQELGNMRGVGICESNIGTIHLRNNHYGEAIMAYQAAVNISTNEINDFTETSENGPDSKQQNTTENGFQNLNREKLILANRMFNLANAHMLESRYSKNQRWQSAIDNYQLVKRMDQNLNINPHRVILISIELARVYLQIGNTLKAEQSLKEAEENLIQKAFDSLDIPRVILENKIKIMKAELARERGDVFEATELLTTVLEDSDLYDPADKKQCLEELRSIFKESHLDYSEIDQMLGKFKVQNFEFVFLVDASYSMSGIKIQNAIVTIRNIFANYIGPDDKVGYIYFNDSPQIIFNLTYKSSNQYQLQSYLRKIPETKGATSLLGTIYLALQQFKTNDLDNLPLSKKKKDELERNKWIIMITDGGDDFEDSSERSFKKLQQFMQKQKVNILVVGYTKNEQKIEFLQKISKVTFQSQFIDVDHADDLSPFFQGLVEGPTEKLPALESF